MAGALAQSGVAGFFAEPAPYYYDRASAVYPASGRASHVAGLNGTHVLLAGGSGAGSALSGSTTVFDVTAMSTVDETPASVNGLAALGRAGVNRAAFATVHLDALGSSLANDVVLAFGGADSFGAPDASLLQLKLSTGACGCCRGVQVP